MAILVSSNDLGEIFVSLQLDDVVHIPIESETACHGPHRASTQLVCEKMTQKLYRITLKEKTKTCRNSNLFPIDDYNFSMLIN